MLQYRRKNSKKTLLAKPLNQIDGILLLTYCNWSYSSNYHIDLSILKNILHSFNHEYILFYLRIFNETPSKVVEAFLEQYQISKSSVHAIAQSLESDGFKVKVLF